MSKQNNIPKNSSNHQQQGKSKPFKRRKAPANKSKEIQINQFSIKVGETVYDMTDKKYDDYPDKVKEALQPAQKLFAKVFVDIMLRDFHNHLTPDQKAAYEAAPKSEKQAIFDNWLKAEIQKKKKQ